MFLGLSVLLLGICSVCVCDISGVCIHLLKAVLRELKWCLAQKKLRVEFAGRVLKCWSLWPFVSSYIILCCV